MHQWQRFIRGTRTHAHTRTHTPALIMQCSCSFKCSWKNCLFVFLLAVQKPNDCHACPASCENRREFNISHTALTHAHTTPPENETVTSGSWYASYVNSNHSPGPIRHLVAKTRATDPRTKLETAILLDDSAVAPEIRYLLVFLRKHCLALQIHDEPS